MRGVATGQAPHQQPPPAHPVGERSRRRRCRPPRRPRTRPRRSRPAGRRSRGRRPAGAGRAPGGRTGSRCAGGHDQQEADRPGVGRRRGRRVRVGRGHVDGQPAAGAVEPEGDRQAGHQEDQGRPRAEGGDGERREQRPDGEADVAADHEPGEAGRRPAGREPVGDARGLRVEGGDAEARARDARQDPRVAAGEAGQAPARRWRRPRRPTGTPASRGGRRGARTAAGWPTRRAGTTARIMLAPRSERP